MANLPTAELSKIETPFYFYDLDLLHKTLRALRLHTSERPNWHIHYALKANNDVRIMELIRDFGLGIDAVSIGEINLALDAGFKSADIVFAGVAKTDKEIEQALGHGIGMFNVESLEELDAISATATKMGLTANVALRINPNIDAHTHKYITTGLEENKFGIDRRFLGEAVSKSLSLPGICLTGLHFHIGSQITITEPFEILCDRVAEIVDEATRLGASIKHINVGGGLGVDYTDPDSNPIPNFKEYFEVFSNKLRLNPDQHLHFELGRSIVAQCGSLISSVIYVKKGYSKKFAIIDAGFTELIRPALYNATHRIDVIDPISDGCEIYDVVGPICESSDLFATEITLPRLHTGTLIAIRSAGAYGQTMAMYYNMRPKNPAQYKEINDK